MLTGSRTWRRPRGDDGARPRGRRRQARRVRGGAVHARRDVRDPGAAARRGRATRPAPATASPAASSATSTRPVPAAATTMTRCGLRWRTARRWPRSTSRTSAPTRVSALTETEIADRLGEFKRLTHFEPRAPRSGRGRPTVLRESSELEISRSAEVSVSENETQTDGGGAATAEAGNDTLTLTDNRTGETYEVEINDGTIKAIDLRQIKVTDDDFGLMATTRRSRTPRRAARRSPSSTARRASSSTAASRSSSSARSRASSRSRSC